MPAMDSTGTDRIAPFHTLWGSHNGISSTDTAAMLKRAAEILKAKGYDRYSKTEDETSAGLTIFEAVEAAAREYSTVTVSRYSLEAAEAARLIEDETNTLADELAQRLAGVLIATGQVNSIYCRNDLTEIVWHWTRESVPSVTSGRYRGLEHAIRVLELASTMAALSELAR